MKRKLIAISMASVLTCGLIVGCGVEYEPPEDPTKSYLYVDTADGGFGSEYLNVVARAFEAAYAEKSYERSLAMKTITGAPLKHPFANSLS